MWAIKMNYEMIRLAIISFAIGVILYQIYKFVFADLFRDLEKLANNIEFSQKLENRENDYAWVERYFRKHSLRQVMENMAQLVEKIKNKWEIKNK